MVARCRAVLRKPLLPVWLGGGEGPPRSDASPDRYTQSAVGRLLAADDELTWHDLSEWAVVSAKEGQARNSLDAVEKETARAAVGAPLAALLVRVRALAAHRMSRRSPDQGRRGRRDRASCVWGVVRWTGAATSV